MKPLVLLFCAVGFAAPLARAEVSTRVGTETFSRGLSAGGEYISAYSGPQGDSHSDGSPSAHTLLPPADSFDVFGAHYAASGSASLDAVASDARVDWAPAPAGTTQVSLASWNTASQYLNRLADSGGRLRVTMTYDLFSSGPGAKATLDAFAAGWSVDGWNDKSILLLADNGEHEQGVWSSDWRTFSSAAELQAIGSTAPSWAYGVNLGTELNPSFGNGPASGGLSAYSHATLVLELAPVPEPESYALLLGGLGLVGMTVRRRRNS